MTRPDAVQRARTVDVELEVAAITERGGDGGGEGLRERKVVVVVVTG
jgi:hypothetical protein